MVFDKMAAKFVWISKQTVFQISSIIGNVDHLETNLCLGFKWSGFWISDLIWNPDHTETNIFLTIRNLTKSGFQIPTVNLIPYILQTLSRHHSWMAPKKKTILQFYLTLKANIPVLL